MKVFRDLLIEGETDQLLAAVEAIRESMSDDWRWDRVSEERLRTIGTAGPCYCFACLQKGRRPAATVFMTPKAPRTLSVANVVPLTKHQLSNDEYNLILEDFFTRFVEPASARTGVRPELTKTQADLEQWMSRGAAEKLRTFTASAKKGTWASHPGDRERWNDFVLSAHQDNSNLDGSILRRWLVEVEDWPPEVADLLASEYEFGREILAFAEGRRSA